jgi:hypothetical protein
MDDVVALITALLAQEDGKLSDDIAKILMKERRGELRKATAASKRQLQDEAAVDVKQRNDLRHRLTALESELANVPASGAGWTPAPRFSGVVSMEDSRHS